jgi:curved DNA-binding protein CbpA
MISLHENEITKKQAFKGNPEIRESGKRVIRESDKRKSVNCPSMQRCFLAFLLLFTTTVCVNAQQAAISDSLWCDHLNEIIKCASIDEITDRIGKGIRDSDFIPAFAPSLKLSRSPTESIKKEYGKISYECYLYSGSAADKKLEDQYKWWYKKIKACLYLWEEARLKNGDTSISVPDDYFFTNSEDETSVRLDLIKDYGYHVRLRIF